MTRIHFLIGFVVTTLLMIAATIAIISGKNFEQMLGRNALDFMTIFAFALGASAMFELREKASECTSDNGKTEAPSAE